jgi:hypothetical protein
MPTGSSTIPRTGSIPCTNCPSPAARQFGDIPDVRRWGDWHAPVHRAGLWTGRVKKTPPCLAITRTCRATQIVRCRGRRAARRQRFIPSGLANEILLDVFETRLFERPSNWASVRRLCCRSETGRHGRGRHHLRRGRRCGHRFDRFPNNERLFIPATHQSLCGHAGDQRWVTRPTLCPASAAGS